MSEAEDRGGLRPVADMISGLLKNPVVIEGLIAGVSAISASRRTKRADTSDGRSFDMGGMLDMLPQILPLLSLLSPSGGSSEEKPSELTAVSAEPELSDFDASAEPTQNDIPAIADAADAASTGTFPDFTVSYESPQAQRENLLLAIRPFLSESRRSAADAMVQVNKLSGLFGRQKG